MSSDSIEYLIMRLLEHIDRLLESYGSRIPSEHPIAYHGSDRDGLQRLRGGRPSYRGGIGGGVYVAYRKSVAEFYGDHLYKVRLKFRKSDIFVISQGNVEWPRYISGNSILTGEKLQPFIFDLDGTKYLVAREHWKDRAQAAFRFMYLRNTMYDLDVPLEVFDILDIHESSDVAWAEAPNLDKVYPELNEGLRDIILARWIENGGDPDVSFDEPSDEFIDYEIEFMEPIMSELQNTYDAADRAFEDEFDHIIDLEDIGIEVENAGYKAVWFVGMRGGAEVNTELLVFDDRDVGLVEQLK